MSQTVSVVDVKSGATLNLVIQQDQAAQQIINCVNSSDVASNITSAVTNSLGLTVKDTTTNTNQGTVTGTTTATSSISLFSFESMIGSLCSCCILFVVIMLIWAVSGMFKGKSGKSGKSSTKVGKTISSPKPSIASVKITKSPSTSWTTRATNLFKNTKFGKK